MPHAFVLRRCTTFRILRFRSAQLNVPVAKLLRSFFPHHPLGSSGFLPLFQWIYIMVFINLGLQGFRVTGIQGFRVTGLQDFRVTGLQEFRVTGLQA
jgi:ureidoglycolate hydrolase